MVTKPLIVLNNFTRILDFHWTSVLKVPPNQFSYESICPSGIFWLTLGGLLVAERLITPWMNYFIRVYYWGTKATWSVYTSWVEEENGPTEGLKRIFMLSKGIWSNEISDLKRLPS